jgi:hypothetical protein
MSDPAGYTLADAAEKLSLSVDQVRDLIAAGALKVTGSGDDPRVTPESLVVYRMSRVSSDLERFSKRPRALAVAADILLPLTIALWFMAASAEVYSLREENPIVPLPAAVAVLGALLGLAWLLAWKADGISSTNGMGTELFGRRMTSEGRVGTQWLTLVSIPLLPVRSYVILEIGETKSNWVGTRETKHYRLRPLGRMYWPQVLPILAGVWAGVAGLVALALFLP